MWWGRGGGGGAKGESLSQWEMTNAICPEHSACVNPWRVPAGPHPTLRPLHPPILPTFLSASTGWVDPSQRSSGLQSKTLFFRRLWWGECPVHTNWDAVKTDYISVLIWLLVGILIGLQERTVKGLFRYFCILQLCLLSKVYPRFWSFVVLRLKICSLNPLWKLPVGVWRLAASPVKTEASILTCFKIVLLRPLLPFQLRLDQKFVVQVWYENLQGLSTIRHLKVAASTVVKHPSWSASKIVRLLIADVNYWNVRKTMTFLDIGNPISKPGNFVKWSVVLFNRLWSKIQELHLQLKWPKHPSWPASMIKLLLPLPLLLL